jgi:hypothetical protein
MARTSLLSFAAKMRSSTHAFFTFVRAIINVFVSSISITRDNNYNLLIYKALNTINILKRYHYKFKYNVIKYEMIPTSTRLKFTIIFGDKMPF